MALKTTVKKLRGNVRKPKRNYIFWDMSSGEPRPEKGPNDVLIVFVEDEVPVKKDEND